MSKLFEAPSRNMLIECATYYVTLVNYFKVE
jgi:hypothetical protein